MIKSQFYNETTYQVTMASVRALLVRGLISADEYAVIDTIMRKKYTPLLGGLYL